MAETWQGSLSDNEEVDSQEFGGGSDDEWEEEESEKEGEDEDTVLVQHLFEDRMCRLDEMLEDCRMKYDFDIRKIQAEMHLDLADLIKLVNYVRATVQDGKRPPRHLAKADFDQDQYLDPVRPDDALLYSLGSLLLDEEGHDQGSEQSDEQDAEVASTAKMLDRLDVEATATIVVDYKHKLAAAQRKTEELTKRLDLAQKALEKSSLASCSGAPSAANTIEKSSPADDSCYTGVSIHQDMLQDRVRTESYRNFILGNKQLFQGKTVLDVGCGTGILSMFCAQAGAQEVFAVEKTSTYRKAQQIVFENGFQDTIRVLHGDIREVTLPAPKVDIIVSEWMGYALLFEGMLDDVIWAREQYLKPDGLMIPSFTSLQICPFASQKYAHDRHGFWDDVYGFNMSAMRAGQEHHVEDVAMSADDVWGSAASFRTLCMYDASCADLVFSDARFSCTRNDSASSNESRPDGFLIWFDTYFDIDRPQQGTNDNESSSQRPHRNPPIDMRQDGAGNVEFSTGPFGPRTHWKQAVLFMNPSNRQKQRHRKDRKDQDMTMPASQSSTTLPTIHGKVRYSKGKRRGDLDIAIEWNYSETGTETETETDPVFTQQWSLT